MTDYHARTARRARSAWLNGVLALSAMLGGFSILGLHSFPARAETVVTIVRGAEADGSERLTADLALLWRASAAYEGSWLAVRAIDNPRSRLRAVRLGRAGFAVIDAGSFAALRGEYPDLVVLSALMPLAIHPLMRTESGPIRNIPGTIAYTAYAKFAALTLAEIGRASAAAPPSAGQPPPTFTNPPSSGPVLLPVNPRGAVELLRRGLPADTLLLLAAPLGTQDIGAALQADSSLHLVNLAPALASAVRRDRPWVFTLPIARGYYPSQAESVDAPAVHLLLVTVPDLSQDDARRMLECLYGRREQVASADPLFASVDRRINSEFAKWAPYHAEAIKEFGLTP